MDETLLRELCRLAPFENSADARLALISAMETLGFLLPQHLLRELAAALPTDYAKALASGQAVSRSSERGTAAEQTIASTGQAVERIQEVYGVLARRLPAELVADLVRELPAQLASAFAGGGAHSVPAAEQMPRHQGERHVSEASRENPRSLANGRPRGAQQDSVAVTHNPHGDTKLSSAQGLTQEREAESLAETSAQPARRDGRP